jgi:phosphatidylserine decarboxylase
MKSLLWSNLISKGMGAVAGIVWKAPFNTLVVGLFKVAVGIQLDEAEQSQLSEYDSIQALFTRSLRPEFRPMGEGVVSPCDGTIYDEGFINRQRQLVVKGESYTADTLLGSHENGLESGYFISIYLSPKDCHQYRMPFDAVIKRVIHIPGRCLPVHPLALKFIPAIYTENERVVVELEHNGIRSYMVMVAALNVGKMTIDVLPELQTNAKNARYRRVYNVNKMLKKGDKLGQFELGSTIVLLFPPEFLLETSVKNRSELPVKYGQTLYVVSESKISQKNDH